VLTEVVFDLNDTIERIPVEPHVMSSMWDWLVCNIGFEMAEKGSFQLQAEIDQAYNRPEVVEPVQVFVFPPKNPYAILRVKSNDQERVMCYLGCDDAELLSHLFSVVMPATAELRIAIEKSHEALGQERDGAALTASDKRIRRKQLTDIHKAVDCLNDRSSWSMFSLLVNDELTSKKQLFEAIQEAVLQLYEIHLEKEGILWIKHQLVMNGLLIAEPDSGVLNGDARKLVYSPMFVDLLIRSQEWYEKQIEAEKISKERKKFEDAATRDHLVKFDAIRKRDSLQFQLAGVEVEISAATIIADASKVALEAFDAANPPPADNQT